MESSSASPAGELHPGEEWGKLSPVRLAEFPPKSLAKLLFAQGFVFDFYQAIRLLERISPDHAPVGRTAAPSKEMVRLRSWISFEFPPSTIRDILPPTDKLQIPTMSVAFMGLVGPSGVLPRHYTELLLRLERERRDSERYILRDWFDMFNHRMISLLYRAWEKYRFYIAYERGEYAETEPDAFTRSLFSLIGLGMPAFRNRMRISAQAKSESPKELGKIDDISLLRFSGFFGHRPRCAISLQVLLANYLKVPVEVQQFQGQWLRLESASQSSLGVFGINNGMGRDAVIGDRIWDVQSKIRIRIGALTYDQFVRFIPDPSPVRQRKALFLVAQLVRYYVGTELDVEVQLVLKASDVPMCQMGHGSSPLGARIGWNCWSRSKPMANDADDPIFPANDKILLQIND